MELRENSQEISRKKQYQYFFYGKNPDWTLSNIGRKNLGNLGKKLPDFFHGGLGTLKSDEKEWFSEIFL